MASSGTSARPFARLATRLVLVATGLAAVTVGTAVNHPASATLTQHRQAGLAAHVSSRQTPVYLADLPVETVAQAPSVPLTVGPPQATTAPAPPPSPTYRDFLIGDDGLHTSVTTYSDCTGATPLTHASAALDTCVTDRMYFVGHNPGVFTPLMTMGVGSLITYWDSAGVPHTVRVIAALVWARTSGTPSPTPGATMEFQTCANASGSILRNLEAAPA